MMKNTTQTKYPIVLVHGFNGFDKIMGFPYFFNIDNSLKKNGAIVFTPALSAAHSTEMRGEQLLAEINKILKETKTNKVNLIGHSQGALTCRYVAAVSPELVASVTSVNGVNFGSEIADIALGVLNAKVIGDVATKIMDCFTKFFSLLSNKALLPQDYYQAIYSLSTEGTAKFNEKYPQGLPKEWGGEGNELESNGVYYYSWSGIIKSDACDNEGLNRMDPSHIILATLSQFFTKEKHQNDGLVGRFSSHLGKVIKSDYQMDHFDSVNQIANLHPKDPNPVDLYIEHAKRLKEKGL